MKEREKVSDRERKRCREKEKERKRDRKKENRKSIEGKRTKVIEMLNLLKFSIHRKLLIGKGPVYHKKKYINTKLRRKSV